MNTRRALSLIELLVIMSICTVILTLIGVLLQRAMRIQMQSRSVTAAERTAQRLATQFRRDVHEARAAEVTNPAEGQDAFLRLELVDARSVEYARLESVVRRLESGNEKPVWREDFVFPAVSELTIKEQDVPRRLTLTITAQPNEPKAAEGKPLVRHIAAPLSIQVEAVVGHHLRFHDARAAQEAPE